jgi:hypothetical protein
MRIGRRLFVTELLLMKIIRSPLSCIRIERNELKSKLDERPITIQNGICPKRERMN